MIWELQDLSLRSFEMSDDRLDEKCVMSQDKIDCNEWNELQELDLTSRCQQGIFCHDKEWRLARDSMNNFKFENNLTDHVCRIDSKIIPQHH